MRVLILKNLFVAFFTGLLLVGGIIFAYQVTSNPADSGKAYPALENVLPQYKGKMTELRNPSNAFELSTPVSHRVMGHYSVSSNSRTENSHNSTGAVPSTVPVVFLTSEVQTAQSRYTSGNSSTSNYPQSHYNHHNSSDISDNGAISSGLSRSNNRNLAYNSISGSMVDGLNVLSSSILASSDLAGTSSMQKVTFPPTGLNPDGADSVPVGDGIYILFFLILLKFIVFDWRVSKTKLFVFLKFNKRQY